MTLNNRPLAPRETSILDMVGHPDTYEIHCQFDYLFFTSPIPFCSSSCDLVQRDKHLAVQTKGWFITVKHLYLECIFAWR